MGERGERVAILATGQVCDSTGGRGRGRREERWRRGGVE